MEENKKFEKGMISLSFDDGWKSISTNAFPLLQKAGIKSTHYIISGCLDDTQFPRYMNEEDIKELAEAGHEIGCHTVSHKHLPQESDSIIEEEVFLSLKFLKNLGLSVETFAYPFGEYDNRVLETVKKDGFAGARSFSFGFNDRTADKFLLKCQAVKVGTPLKKIKEWISLAQKENLWLILAFHQIDEEGREWSTTPARLKEILDFVLLSKIKTMTLKEGIGLLA